MSTFLLVVVFPIVYLSVGLAAGWWTHRQVSRRNARLHQRGDSLAQSSNRGLDKDRAKELLRRMHELASTVSADVDEHSASLSQAKEELASLSSESTDAASEIAIQVITDVIESNSKLQSKLDEARDTIEAQAEQMQIQMAEALSDGLTGLPNRRAFDREIERRIAEWDRKDTPVSVVMLDVDHFKSFNDQHGHQAGDEVLRGVAAVLLRTARTMDVPARYGGEEFAAILPNTTLDLAEKFAERLRSRLEGSTITFNDLDFQVTASLGVAQSQDGDDSASLIKRADQALYASKEDGRNCTHVHDARGCRRVGSSTEQSSKKCSPSPIAEESRQGEQSPSPHDEPGDGEQTNSPRNHDPRTDPQTGLPNRSTFFEDLRRRLAERRRHETPLAVMLIEISQMAELKTRHGQKAADLVLTALPQFLKGVTRGSDLIARYGDHQFAVCLVHTDLAGAVVASERVRKAVACCDKLKLGEVPIAFTVRVGVAEANQLEDSAALAGRAETALSRSKNSKSATPRTWFHDGDRCQAVETVTDGVDGSQSCV